MIRQAIGQVREENQALTILKQYLVQWRGKEPEDASWVQTVIQHTLISTLRTRSMSRGAVPQHMITRTFDMNSQILTFGDIILTRTK